MKKATLILTIILCFTLVGSAQEKIYMPYFELINVHPDYKQATAQLLKTYIETENKFELIIPKKDTTNYLETKQQAFLKAKNLKIKYVLIGTLNRVGETVVASISLYNIQSDKKVWATIKKASSPDDLDPILQEIAATINSQNFSTNSESVYTVSNYDSKSLNKKRANTSFGFEIGGAAAFVDVANQFPTGFGFLYSGDTRNLIFDLKANMYFSSLNLFNLSIHVNHPLLKKASSPYVGGGLGFGSARLKVETNNYDYNTYNGNGLTFYAGGGYLFNRTSSINLRLNADMFLSAYQVDGSYPFGFDFGLIVLF